MKLISLKLSAACEIEVTKFTGVLCKMLEDDVVKQCAPRRSHISRREAYGEAKLESIAGPDGYMNCPATSK